MEDNEHICLYCGDEFDYKKEGLIFASYGEPLAFWYDGFTFEDDEACHYFGFCTVYHFKKWIEQKKYQEIVKAIKGEVR